MKKGKKMSTWDGRDRRKESDDHDVLIEISRDLKNHLSNFEDLHAEFTEHSSEDKKQFSWLTKIAYIGIGGIVVLQFVMNHFK